MKSKKLIQFESDFNNINLLKMFEIEVVNKQTNEQTYIIFDIAIVGKKFVAQHESLTNKQARSKKIAFVSVKIDPDFSLDENLQSLYSECINAILGSDFYALPE